MGLIGVLLTAVCHPYPLHVMPPEAFAMRPHRWLSLLSEVGGTVSAAPNFAYELCAARPDDVGRLRLDGWRAALNGSEPVQRRTAERFAARFVPQGFRPDVALPVYGLAESTLAVTFGRAGGVRSLPLDPDALARHGRAVITVGESARDAVSVGAPVAGASVAVVDREGAVLRDGAVGEVRVAGPSLMDGYFRNEAASAAALESGWLRTGDLGFVHEGELYVVGRARDVIIKGGRNYHAPDLERVAATGAGVRAEGVAAFGRASEATGTDDVVLVVETLERDPAARERIAREVRGEVLATLGVRVDEVRLCRIGAVPRTTSGKIRRAACARSFPPAAEAP
jgi:acyl-CoA synthetase (AMP-forming)/AMP-acid ligase II